MATIIYTLCTLTALICTCLLLNSYVKQGYRLLLWSGLCFLGLTINNLLLMFDRIIFPTHDLSTLRLSIALISLLPLLYGLIWEDE